MRPSYSLVNIAIELKVRGKNAGNHHYSFYHWLQKYKGKYTLLQFYCNITFSQLNKNYKHFSKIPV